MAAILRSGARMVAGPAMLKPAPVAGALLQRSVAAGPLFKAASFSSRPPVSTRALAEQYLYIRDREIAMLQGLAYKVPSFAPATVPSQPVSADRVKNRAVVIGAVAVLSGAGWYMLARSEVGQKVDDGRGGDKADGQKAVGGDKADGQKAVGGDKADGGQKAVGGDKADGGQKAVGGDKADGGQKAVGGDKADGQKAVGGDKAKTGNGQAKSGQDQKAGEGQKKTG